MWNCDCAQKPSWFIQLTQGDFDNNNINIPMALKWQDKREVIIFSTIHTPKMIPIRKNDWKIQKPECIVNYKRKHGLS